MGTSTNAILAYGFDLGDELPEAFKDDEAEYFDFEEWAAAELGLEDWSEDRPDDFWKRRKAAIEALPVDMISHCSGDYPMYFLAIRGTEQVARRGTPEIANVSAPSAEAVAGMREFCAKYGIDWREPKWHIFSMWH